jgi:primosomal protein N' (replication factor Y)
MSEKSPKEAALVAINGIAKPLSYFCNPTQTVAVGSEVTVNLGKRKTTGWVVGKIDTNKAIAEISKNKKHDSQTSLSFVESDSNLKNNKLKSLSLNFQAFLPEQIELFNWMADYYGTSLAEVINNAIPKFSNAKQTAFLTLSQKAKNEILNNQEFISKLSKKSKIQAEIIGTLRNNKDYIPITEFNNLGSSVYSSVNALKKKGLIEQVTRINTSRFEGFKEENNRKSYFKKTKPEKLTASQQLAIDTVFQSIDCHSFDPLLLFGVTGSGKTEIYIRSIEKVLAEGGGALLVVPEIALTPQLLDEFRSRLNSPIAVLHSQIGASEKWFAWEALVKGEIKLAIGARSAIFAPVKDLSLIIVDEEHESSYKQSDGFRYHGRDVAVMRAKFANCPIILGSATPSFESLLNVKKGKYKLIEIADRVTQRPLPEIEVIDLNKIHKKEMPSENISPKLFQAIDETLSAREQIVILYNKRGFSSYLQCNSCNEVLLCPNCSVAFTYHKGKKRLLCHYCGHTEGIPNKCPLCRNPKTTRVEVDADGNLVASKKHLEKVGDLIHRGSGTEKVVEEITNFFPNARIARLDRDTVSGKDSYREILGSMKNGKADILIGTQMIAKGHDIPGVTLVAIIDADVGLHLPDFRASEKAFQLITQASGRAGRGDTQGRVLIQTREPNHPTIVAASKGRFKAFARYEMDYRKSLNYPPWGKLLRVVISSTNSQDAYSLSCNVKDILTKFVNQKLAAANDGEINLTLLGPSPAPHERLRGRFRWHFLIKSNSAKSISELANSLNLIKLNKANDCRISVDVDPVDML